jgi:hypothetical protein
MKSIRDMWWHWEKTIQRQLIHVQTAAEREFNYVNSEVPQQDDLETEY